MSQTEQHSEQPQPSFIDDLIAKGSETLKAKLLAWYEAWKPELQMFKAKVDALTEQFMRERLGIDLSLIETKSKQEERE